MLTRRRARGLVAPPPIPILLLFLLGLAAVDAQSQSPESQPTQTQTQALAHCRDYREHCAFNASTSSCVFSTSVTFACGPNFNSSTPTNPTVGTNDSNSSNASAPIQTPSVDDSWDCPWELTGDLVLAPDVVVAVQGDACRLRVSVGHMLLLSRRAQLHASAVSVDAAYVRVERDALLSARVSGLEDALLPGDDAVGASLGGSGGRRLDLNNPSPPSIVPEALAAAWDLEPLWTAVIAGDQNASRLLMGSGSRVKNTTSGQVVAVGGGGRVRIIASRDLVLMENATIAANGDSAIDGISAGSGGTVFLSAVALSVTKGHIQARGGDAHCFGPTISRCFPGSLVNSNGMGGQPNQGPGSGECVGSIGGGGGYGGRGADSSTVNEVGDYASGGLAYGDYSLVYLELLYKESSQSLVSNF
ncbi:hypothetical protein ATCC90586_001350 [Pythium insidiosum]|nr:hypothetical protein ATCC90586_001350 [Pythium insidiosum]